MLLAALPLAVIAQARDCDEGRPARRAQRIAVLRQALAAASLDRASVVPVDLPAGVARDLDALKDELQALVSDSLACTPSDDPGELESALQRRVPRDLDVPPLDDGDEFASRYGREITFRVTLDSATPRRLVVVTDLGIQCGDDALLAVFEPGDRQWVERLRWRAPSYDQIGAAHGSLAFALSPIDEDRRWHLVASAVSPWCSSTWSSIHAVALRPGPTPDAPQVLLDESHSMWWGGDDFGQLAASVDGVELRFHSSSIDPGVHNRLFVRRFRFEGERLIRVPPVAESPRDFVDEWIVSTPDEAMGWTAPAARARLRPLKSVFTGDRRAALEFGTPATCPGGERRIAVQRLEHETIWYFRVRDTEGAYELVDAGTGKDATCIDDPVPESAADPPLPPAGAP